MKTIANPLAAAKKFLRWLILALSAGGAIALAVSVKTYADHELAPFGINLPPLDGQDKVDPRTAITLEAIGLGAKIAKAELRDGSGKLLAEASGQTRVVFDQPLAFGTRHTVKATVEREWPQQSETREFSFTTVGIPTLEGPTLRMLAPDASVTLHFDQPIGELEAKGDLRLSAEADASHQNIRLIASDYAQDRTYPVQLNWKTATGVPLPPLSLELATAPPLAATTNVKGLSNLGIALPLKLNFSEALADRANAAHNIQVQTTDGKPVAGRWGWQGQRLLMFTPQPGWPPSSTIEVRIDPQALKTVRGGTLPAPFTAQFNTGTDRRLFVYLDTQQVVATENGQVVRTFKVSTGKAKTPTATGSFYIYDRYLHKTMRSDVPKGQKGYYEVEDVPYTQFFHKDYAFHGAFWHNSFGHPASHGCVNMATKDHNTRWPNSPEDAGWLYRWAALGVPVTVSAQSPAPPVLEADKAEDRPKPALETHLAEAKDSAASKQEPELATAPTPEPAPLP